MWECPNYVSFENTRCLIVSPMNVPFSPAGYQKHGKPIYILGTEENDRLIQKNSQTVDFGSDFYAPQIFFGTEGRILLIGWLDMWGKEIPTGKDGWAGLLTLPRELTLKDGHIYTMPAQELLVLRQKQILKLFDHIAKNGVNVLPEPLGESIELAMRVRFDDPSCKKLILRLRISESSPAATIEYDPAEAILRIYKADADVPASSAQVVFSKLRYLTLRLYIDRSSLEIFVNDGQLVLSERIYPKEESSHYSLSAEGGSFFVEEAAAWELGDCWR